ncbi:MAG: hypothetical protein JJ926_07425 [Roseitalea sp.]|jgi:hypothetical protein|nr:AprI/Inh family metalloprotease inhibitor [Oceaniradius stylonematis]MBO6551925.1 hypothetical protein [Roseitalea sp.]MBO6951695.1 hypothetical protein [Rhizobiaceae bacterium]RNC95855.1 MAG: hypothetical protein ED558_06750 [Oricola sp.]MBO6592459.1 hypothetical protein [Roseitalea sp.]MBO6598714.1 hypothetical protein [Roseitalea sp.]
MRFNTTQWLNGFAVAGAAAMIIAAGAGAPGSAPSGIDPVTTASVASAAAAGGDRFMALDHRTNISCSFTLHRADGYDVHRVEPGSSCARLGELFARARAWQESRRGTVTVTDHRGTPLMRLAPGDGFAWEVVEPDNVKVSLAAY